MDYKKYGIFFSLYVFVFFVVLFFIDIFFLGTSPLYNDESQYIDKTIPGTPAYTSFDSFSVRDQIISEQILQSVGTHHPDTKEEELITYFISFSPEDLRIEGHGYEKILTLLLSSPSFSDKLDFLNVNLYASNFDVRGKMVKNSIRMYGIGSIPYDEFLSVFIHEFGHYVDLYYFPKDTHSKDVSNIFYASSWEETKVIKPGLLSSDFVSGYAMTNKYEDFAESFAYYVLHNESFLGKTKTSEILKRKYNFMKQYVFPNDVFVDTHFALGSDVKEYYWDITKIPIDLEKFLHFLKK